MEGDARDLIKTLGVDLNRAAAAVETSLYKNWPTAIRIQYLRVQIFWKAVHILVCMLYGRGP